MRRVIGKVRRPGLSLIIMRCFTPGLMEKYEMSHLTGFNNNIADKLLMQVMFGAPSACEI